MVANWGDYVGKKVLAIAERELNTYLVTGNLRRMIQNGDRYELIFENASLEIIYSGQLVRENVVRDSKEISLTANESQLVTLALSK